MALRAVPDHPKFAELKALLSQPKGPVAGWLEMMWHFTGRFTPQGNIGKYSDLAIESWVEWDGAPGALIAALVQAGWIDIDHTHRLLVHDWPDHADKATKNALMRAKLPFCTPGVRTEIHGVRMVDAESSTASRLPGAVPVPVPESGAVPASPPSEPPLTVPRKDMPLKTVEEIGKDIEAGTGIWTIPDGGEKMAAVWLFEELGLANTFGDRELVGQVIAFEARSRGDTQASAEFLLAEARQAMQRGELVNVFWFKDRKFSPEYQAKAGGDSGANNPSPTKQRVDRNREAVAKALERRGISRDFVADYTNGRTLSQPRLGGFSGGVPDGLRAVGDEAFAAGGEVCPPGTKNPARPEILPPA